MKSGWQRDTFGKLVEADLDESVRMQDGRRPMGLYLRTDKAAKIRLQVGETSAGVMETRTFALTPTGAWLSVAGWRHVYAEVLELSGDVVEVSWTAQQPPAQRPLFAVESIVVGQAYVPPGAYELLAGTADAGWTWTTDTSGSSPIAIAAPLVAATQTPVAGAQYTATVGNTVCWRLFPL